MITVVSASAVLVHNINPSFTTSQVLDAYAWYLKLGPLEATSFHHDLRLLIFPVAGAPSEYMIWFMELGDC